MTKSFSSILLLKNMIRFKFRVFLMLVFSLKWARYIGILQYWRYHFWMSYMYIYCIIRTSFLWYRSENYLFFFSKKEKKKKIIFKKDSESEDNNNDEFIQILIQTPSYILVWHCLMVKMITQSYSSFEHNNNSSLEN